MKNIQNERATFAFNKVNAIKKKSFAKEFLTIARSTPAKIQMTGLATTVAFLFAKKQKEPAHKNLYMIIHNWLVERGVIRTSKEEGLMEAITEADLTTYRVMTNEVQHLLIWIKRFAEGLIESDE